MDKMVLKQWKVVHSCDGCRHCIRSKGLYRCQLTERLVSPNESCENYIDLWKGLNLKELRRREGV